MEEIEYKKILSKITADHFDNLVSSHLSSRLKMVFDSLNDVYECDVRAFSKHQSVGVKKAELYERFYVDIKWRERDKFINYYNSQIKSAETETDNIDKTHSVIEIIYCYLNKLFYSNTINKKEKEIIRLYFGVNSVNLETFEFVETKDLIEISTIIGVTSERTRQLKERIILIASSFLPSSFKEKIYKIRDENLYQTSFSSVVTDNNNFDINKISRIAEFFDANYINIDDNYYLVDKKGIRLFRIHYNEIIQFLKSQAKPVSLDLVYSGISSNLGKDGFLVDNIILSSILNNNDNINCISESGNAEYQILWELLASLNIKVSRILYEESRPLHKKDILAEYNQRLEAAGLSDQIISYNQLIIRKTDCIKSVGKTGYWTYFEPGIKDFENTTAVEEIDRFIRKNNGKTTFDEVKNFINGKFFLEDVSIRAYIYKSCKVSSKNPNLFIHLDFINQYPEEKLREFISKDFGNKFIRIVISIFTTQNIESINKNVLIDFINAELSIDGIILKQQKAEYYINKFVNIGVLSITQFQGDKLVSLDKEELNKHNIDTLGKKKEKLYITSVKSMIINHLKDKENKICELDELRNLVKEIIPSNISQNAFYKIIGKSKFLYKIDIDGKSFVKLNQTDLPAPKLYSEEVLEPSENFVEVIIDDKPIEEVIRRTYNWDVLKTRLEEELISDYQLDSANLKAGIDCFYNYLEIKKNSNYNWSSMLLQHIYQLYYNRTDYFDRQSCLTFLIISFETYLKQIHGTSNNYGLYENISLIKPLMEVRDYKEKINSGSVINIDFTKKRFSGIVKTMIYFRNILSHNAADDSMELGFSKQLKTITDFIALYVYVAIIANK